MKLRSIALVFAATIVIGLVIVATVLSRPIAGPDVAALNDLQRRVSAAWAERPDAPSSTNGPLAVAVTPADPPLTILDGAGNILYSTAPHLSSDIQAARANAHSLPVRVDDRIVGQLSVESSIDAQLADRDRSILITTIGTFTLVSAVFAAALAWLWFRILRPFWQLKRFAQDVSRGDLESPLPMDRGNMFGVFSESFDLMRFELLNSRKAESATREETRETLAQIGHDLRTPVAVIAAAGEVLELDEQNPARRARVDVIRSRSAQIARLLDDLIETNAQDLTGLAVSVAPHSSDAFADLIRECDTTQSVRPFSIPDCVIDYDPVRMRQVVDNILSNSLKFAGTPVTLDAELTGTATPDKTSAALRGPRTLRLRFSDAGPGITTKELGSILAKGVRGSNAEGIPGSGLGLHIAAQLTERMGGELAVESDQESGRAGFTVALLFPLSGDEFGR